jgi:hypothetical protein
MNIIRSYLALLVLCGAMLVSGCVGPNYSSARVTHATIRDSVPGEEIAVIRSEVELKMLIGAFARATPRKLTGDQYGELVWRQCVDVIGDRPIRGRWLVNLETGTMSRLSHFIEPVLVLTPADAEMLRRLFQRKP